MAEVAQNTGVAAVVGQMLSNPQKKVANSNVRTIKGFEIGHVLGKGGFSEVFLGFDREQNRRVALKCMFNDPNVKSQKKQIVAELDAMSKIKHKNVVKLYDSDTEAKFPQKDGSLRDTILVVLELATGGELFDYLMYTGKFEEKLARTYFRQLIDGVEACHKQGVAHRDLKPENLLLDENYVLKLADFGFASVFQDDGNKKYMLTECGTRAYMAPEILAHQKYDETADLWACGIIAFIMIAGFPPLQQANQQDWWFHKLKIKRHNLFWAAHERTAKFSEEAKDFIVKMLAAEPKERMTVDQIRNHAWFKAPVYTDAEATNIMKERKRVSDQKKAAERREQQKKARAHRAVGDEELPVNQPGMSDGAVMAELIEGTLGDWSTQPPTFDEKLHMATCTEFQANEDPKAVLTRVAQVIKGLDGRVFLDSINYTLQGQVNTQLGLIRFGCSVKDMGNEVSLVSFKRQGGNPVNWTKLYNDNLVAQLTDCILVE